MQPHGTDESTSSRPPHPALEALTSGIARDRVLQLGVLTVVAAAVVLLSAPAERLSAGYGQMLVIVQIAVLMVSLQWGLQRIPQKEERRFWTDLTIGCGLWAVAVLPLPWPPAVAHLVRALFYLAFLFAIERDLERRAGLHPVDYGRTLRWPGGTVFVFGLLTYFLLIPALMVDGESDLPPAAMFFILDFYLGGRFWMRRRQIKYERWRLLYGLLAVGMTALFVIDGLGLFFAPDASAAGPAWTAAWTIPILFFLAAGRLRHQPMPTQESLFDSVRRKDELSLPKERMIFFALSFPVIHLTASAFNLIEDETRLVREVTVLGWLFLIGALALVQQRLLEKKARSLWMERMRAEEALHKSEETLRLINERVEAERALRISEEKFAKAFRASPDSVVIATLEEGRILEVNNGTESVTGYPREQIIGRTAVELGLWVDPEKRWELVEKLRGRQSVRDFSFELRRRSGEVAVAELSAELLELDGEDHLLLIVRDVTDQKQLEQQVLRTRRMEGLATLAGGLAHDLNNVLTPVVMTVQLLRNQLDDSRHRQLVSTLEKNVMRGARMVKKVMSLARGADGETATLDPRRVLSDMEKILLESFPEEIRVRTRIIRQTDSINDIGSADDLWPIEGDVNQIQQALLNLCENARDAILRSNGRGEIILEAENVYLDQLYARVHPGAQEGNYVALSVVDEGDGISPEIRDRIFDPFFTTKSIGQGAGLGLSTALAIVKNHQGFMDVYSEAGNGTRAQIFLPGKVDAEILASTEHFELPFGRGEMILVVDDEVSVREITRQTLETFGYKSLIAANGVEGVELFKRRREEIDLVLLDMIMPVMDGAEALTALRELDPEVRVVAISGLGPADRVKIDDNVLTFLAKPFTAARLLMTLRDALERKS